MEALEDCAVAVSEGGGVGRAGGGGAGEGEQLVGDAGVGGDDDQGPAGGVLLDDVDYLAVASGSPTEVPPNFITITAADHAVRGGASEALGLWTAAGTCRVSRVQSSNAGHGGWDAGALDQAAAQISHSVDRPNPARLPPIACRHHRGLGRGLHHSRQRLHLAIEPA